MVKVSTLLLKLAKDLVYRLCKVVHHSKGWRVNFLLVPRSVLPSPDQIPSHPQLLRSMDVIPHILHVTHYYYWKKCFLLISQYHKEKIKRCLEDEIQVNLFFIWWRRYHLTLELAVEIFTYGKQFLSNSQGVYFCSSIWSLLYGEHACVIWSRSIGRS